MRSALVFASFSPSTTFDPIQRERSDRNHFLATLNHPSFFQWLSHRSYIMLGYFPPFQRFDHKMSLSDIHFGIFIVWLLLPSPRYILRKFRLVFGIDLRESNEVSWWKIVIGNDAIRGKRIFMPLFPPEADAVFLKLSFEPYLLWAFQGCGNFF